MNKYNNFIKYVIENDKLSYIRETTENKPLRNLFLFLENNAASHADIEKWENIIIEEKESESNTEMVQLDSENGFIYISFLYADIELEKDKFITSKENMIKIMNKWKSIKEKSVKEIILIELDDGSITLKGHKNLSNIWIKQTITKLPDFFVINITTSKSISSNVEKIGNTILGYLKSKLDNQIGNVWIHSYKTGLNTNKYIFGIKYKTKKNVKDILQQLPDITWNIRTDSNNKNIQRVKASWNKYSTNQTFIHNEILSIDVYTQD